MQENILSIFENINIFENQIVLPVIEMMRHFDMKRYPRERGKKCIHYFGEAIIQGGRLFEGWGY